MPEPRSPVLPSEQGDTLETIIGAGHSKVYPLPAIRMPDDTGTVLTRWTFTWRELFKLVLTRSLWVESWTYGNLFHPIRLHIKEPGLVEDTDTDPEANYQPPLYGREFE